MFWRDGVASQCMVSYLLALVVVALVLTLLPGAVGRNEAASEVFELYGEEPELTQLPHDAVVEAARLEEELAGGGWTLDMYVVSEHVTTYSSPYLGSGLYQHTPHKDAKELTEITEMFATGSINVVGVSLSSGLVSFFESFESLSVPPRGDEGFANLFMSLNTHDSFFIVYTHRATKKTSITLSKLLKFCGSSNMDVLDDDSATESFSYVFVGQCSAISSKRSVWKEYKLNDYLPVRLKARKYVEEDKQWYIDASVDILRYPDDYKAVDSSGSFNFKPPHFGYYTHDIEVQGVDQDGSYKGLVLKMCSTERAEDATDRLARHLGNVNGTYQTLLARICGPLNGTSADVGGRYRGCDGKPPSRIVGVIEADFYVRVGYSVDEVYECYCALVASSLCDSEHHRPSPEYAYISRTLESDARRQKEKQEGGEGAAAAAADVAISLGVNCNTAVLGVSLQWRQTKAQGYLTGPFDLMWSNYEGLVRCMEDDFRHFTNSKYLEVFDYEANHNHEVEMENNKFIVLPRHGQYIRNTYYNFVFPHESPVHIETLKSSNDAPHQHLGNHFVSLDEQYKYIDNDFSLFKERYDRRINNFRHYMKSEAMVTLLISSSVYDVSHLEAAIRAQYPRVKFNINVWLLRAHDSAFRNDYYHLNLLNATSYFR